MSPRNISAGGWLRLLLGLVLLAQAAAAAAGAGETRGRVSWIFDGDTIEVVDLGRVRLLGIDSPEAKASDRDRFYRERFGISPRRLRATAREALRFNIATAKGKTVTLVFDEERRDKHGRLLAYVILPDGRCLNQVLIEQGLATVYRKFSFARKKDFLATETQARQEGRGLWRQ